MSWIFLRNFAIAYTLLCAFVLFVFALVVLAGDLLWRLQRRRRLRGGWMREWRL